MTPDEWDAYAADLRHLIVRTKGIVYELEDAMGAVQFLVQPRRNVDITNMRWPRRVVAHASPLH